MGTLAQMLYIESSFGELLELPKAGSALEHPWVFDATARDLKEMAAQGKIEIVDEHQVLVADEWLIDRLRFRKMA